jgi:hypothetical protein
MKTKTWPLFFMIGLVCLITTMLIHRLINTIHPDALNAYSSTAYAGFIAGMGIGSSIFLLRKALDNKSTQLSPLRKI